MTKAGVHLTSRGPVAAIGALAAAAALAGCKPDLGAPPSLISGPRLIDLRSTPAEAKPGTTVMVEALIVDPTGRLNVPVSWTTCRTPKPPAESNAVSETCVSQADDGAGVTGVTPLMIPADACTLFGPLTPPMRPGQPAARPRDPDPTGGFYQPFRAAARGVAGAEADLLGFALVRVTCPLANAGVEVARQFGDPVDGYHANLAPTFQAVTVTDGNGAESTVVAAGAGTTVPSVPAGLEMTVRASWPPEAAEDYLLFDLTTRELVHRREPLRLSWFATEGEFLHDRTGRDSTEVDAFSENTWKSTDVAPGTVVHFWVVLGDNRGGSDFAAFDVAVSP